MLKIAAPSPSRCSLDTLTNPFHSHPLLPTRGQALFDVMSFILPHWAEVQDQDRSRNQILRYAKLNYALLGEGATREEYRAGIKKLVADGLITVSECGTRLYFTDRGKERFAKKRRDSMQPLHLHLGFGDQYGSAGIIGDFDGYPLVSELGGVVSEDARRSRGGLALHLLHALALYALLIFPDVVSVANVEKAFRHKR